MKTCPHCTTGYPDALDTCPAHGLLLNEIRDLRPGLVIRSTYRIVRKLGRGGMGSVYLADHLLMGEPRALKFISAELAADSAFTHRFLREVKSLRRLRHPNVVDCGDLERAEDESLFFAMEYVDGPTLRHVIGAQPSPMEVGAVLEVARGIAEGLGAAHRLGMVHRDIKPENILMAQRDGRWIPKIVDFGIVATKEYTAATRTGSSALSMAYAAPEQWLGIRGAELDGRTDLYALGGVLYEMLTGRAPLEGESYESWYVQHVKATPLPPSAYRPELAGWSGLDQLVLQLLEKDREQRPKDVARMLARLETIVDRPAAPVPLVAAPQTAESVPRPPMPVPAPVATAPRSVTNGFDPVAYPPAESTAYTFDPDPRPPEPPAPVQSRTTERARPSQSIPVASADEPAERKSGAVRRFWEVLILLVVLAIGLFGWWHMRADSYVLKAHDGAVASVAISPDGSTLASGSWDSTIKLWDLASRQPLRTLTGHAGRVFTVAFSPDGRTLASAGEDKTIRLWDVATGQLQRRMSGHEGAVLSLAFSSDGRTLASAGEDKTIRLWDSLTGQPLRTFADRGGGARSIAFSPDGSLLASGGADGNLRLWDVASGELARTVTGHSNAVAAVTFSSDGRTLASAGLDSAIKLWNPSTGDLLRSITVWGGPVYSLAYSPSGRLLVSGNNDKTAQLWEVASGEPLRSLTGHSEKVGTVAFSRDGGLLASGSWDGTVRLWDVSKLR